MNVCYNSSEQHERPNIGVFLYIVEDTWCGEKKSIEFFLNWPRKFNEGQK